MFDYGKVVSMAAFKAWAAKTEVQLAAVTKMLPPYATTYDPTVVPQINKAMAKAASAAPTATTTRRTTRSSHDPARCREHTALKPTQR